MQKAHAEKIKEMDILAWKFVRDYVLPAVYLSVERNVHGKKAKSEYPKQPLLSKEEQPKQQNSEGRAVIERLNFELRNKMLKDMGFPMPPR